MTLHIRRRTPPTPHQIICGPFSGQMIEGGKYYKDARNRAAYIYITGQFLSHLRKESTSFLRHATARFKKPVSLEGRTGKRKLSDAIARDLELNQHPMVLAVRKKISQGYPTRHHGDTDRPGKRLGRSRLLGPGFWADRNRRPPRTGSTQRLQQGRHKKLPTEQTDI